MGTRGRRVSFAASEYRSQADFLGSTAPAEVGYLGSGLRLTPGSLANLHPLYRDRIVQCFDSGDRSTPGIGWHTHANHGASSQVCCVNFLYPFADKPALLGRWIDHVLGTSGAAPEVIERRNGRDHYVAFEWFPATDYLNEATKAGARKRGSNSTSVDAAACFRLGGERRLLLIEWKYTESYPAKRAKGAANGDATRSRRYHNLWKRPHGPLRLDLDAELEEFFLEPWYQLLRQQMTAYHAETDPLSAYDHAMLLHVSPAANSELRRAKGSLARFGPDVFESFRSMLAPEFADRFLSIDTGAAFGEIASWEGVDWMDWLTGRYPALTTLPAE